MSVVSVRFNKMQILNKCRICLLKTGEWLMFNSYGKEKFNVKTMYEKYTGIHVQEDDDLPKSLCIECIDGLVATHHFIGKCKTADTVLQSLQTVMTLEEPSGYKVVAVEGDTTIEFEYDDHDEQSIVVKDIKAEFETEQTERLTKANPTNLNIDFDDTSIEIKLEVVSNNTEIINSKSEYEVDPSKSNQVVNGTFTPTVQEDLANASVIGENSISSLTNDKNEVDELENDHNNKDKMCSICLKGFKRKDTLINHMRTHTQEKPFQCDTCSAQFSSACNLSRHLRVHTGEKPYICDICGKALTQSTSLKKHKKLHGAAAGTKQTQNFLCSFCGLSFNNTWKFKQHLVNASDHTDLKNHDEIKNLLTNYCKLCDRYFDTKHTLNHHLAVHAGVKNYLCSYCGKKFPTKAALNIHSLIHTAFSLFENIETHRSICLDRGSNKKCGKPLKRLLCSYCGLIFISNLNYFKHLQESHPDNELQNEDKNMFAHICEVCGHYVSSKNCLKIHMASHTGKKNYMCSYCGREFYAKNVLDAHLNIHTGNRPYKCIYCNKSFSQRSTLTSHQYIHTDTRPYQCAYCDKGFKQSHQLTYHLLTHTGEKPYSCDECGKKVATKRILSEHIRIHTGEKPYSCSTCRKCFKCYSGFKKHLQIHSKS